MSAPDRFDLSREEKRLADRFIAEHNARHPDTTAIGGQYTYSFTPTSLGVVIRVKCACGIERTLTDFSQW